MGIYIYIKYILNIIYTALHCSQVRVGGEQGRGDKPYGRGGGVWGVHNINALILAQ